MKFVLSTFIIWRMLLILFAVISQNIIPLREGYLGGGTFNYLTSPLLWGWANMDGVHYLSIAQNGYFQYEQAFFPLYPFLIRSISNIFSGNYIFSGILISNFFFLLSLFVLYKLLQKEFSEKVTKWGIIIILSFPTSFFFASVYTESLFLFLTLMSFYFMGQGRNYHSAFFIALASLCRLVGIFLLPALLLETWIRNKKNFSLIKFIPILLSGVGLLSYMIYLQKTVGDPLFFFHAQPAFGAERSGNEIILLPQVLFRYLKIFITAQLSYDYLIAIFEFLSLFFAVCLLIKRARKTNISYQIFAWSAILTPTLTGSLSSMPRYLLSIFPIFIIVAQENMKIKAIYLVFSLLLLIIGTMFFFRGYFIS
jgi:hypothetical protein